jgi:hypothetical protein
MKLKDVEAVFRSLNAASIPTLIEMKELAGRPRDMDDIQHLKWLLEETQ